MSQIKVRSLKHIPPELAVPGDRLLSHRALLVAGLCDGTSVIDNFLPVDECLTSLEAVKALGVDCEALETDGQGRPIKLAVTGHGMKLKAPAVPVDCGDSAETMQLLTGVLASQSFTTNLTAAPALAARAMRAVVDPLRKMGAEVIGQGADVQPPLFVRGAALKPVTHVLEGPDEAVKDAVLLAGWTAEGKTSVIEPASSRDHIERLLSTFHVKTVRKHCHPVLDGHSGSKVSIYGGQPPEPRDFVIPGDISCAAFWMVAAGARKDARLTLLNVGLNPARAGIIRVLIRMGVKITEHMQQEEGEPCGHVIVQGSELNGTHIAGAEIPTVIDELPILAVAGALAHGETTIRDAAVLRSRKTDQLAAVAHNLRLMGVRVDECNDGMDIVGGTSLQSAELVSYGDPRVAMAFAIAGLYAEGGATILDSDCIETIYTGFSDQLSAFMEVPKDFPDATPVISRIPPRMGARLQQTSS